MKIKIGCRLKSIIKNGGRQKIIKISKAILYQGGCTGNNEK